MSTVHIAGNDIRINQLLRQRCAWCGHVLIDYNLDRIAVPEGQDPEPSTWPVGFLVEVDGGMSVLLDIDALDGLPDNACSAAETRKANAIDAHVLDTIATCRTKRDELPADEDDDGGVRTR